MYLTRNLIKYVLNKKKDLTIYVWPRKWQERIILSDDGVYSICWGTFEGTKGTMGQRWNDNYPRQGSSPT